MPNFIVGQRWINSLETQLGLGTILSCEHRRVRIVFNASGEIRTYAKQSAPLIRVRFSAGDTIQTADGSELSVQSVIDHQGLLTYRALDQHGKSVKIHESALNDFIRMDRPADRLFSAQLDSEQWFELRYQTILKRNAISRSPITGLCGCRTSLIPHQLYIAHEVARRYAPRVLLADEVGLGKTIEAGLILHRQWITEGAERILIVVPESLMHQWLVEMIRRFNLCFNLFDESRCIAVCESSDHENPFFSAQLVLLSLDFLSADPMRAEQAAQGQWDLVVVDEAHHLQWTPESASTEYRIIENIAKTCKGLLLLTGTPEQLGKANHFASLRLIDPDRFPSLEAFREEQSHYAALADAVHGLIDEIPLLPEQSARLNQLLEHEPDIERIQAVLADHPDSPETPQARRRVIDTLVDRHGTGRVLFRNTRATVKGFPSRVIIPCALSCPEPYRELKARPDGDPADFWLYPEAAYRADAAPGKAQWTEFDPRAPWLLNQIRALRDKKVLVIAHCAETVLELADYLKSRGGITAAVFHEGLSLIERDRAAAFFANFENGSPLLICSEIGSEGRNFQFAHDLVLFDLPLNPDLLEQRIGRLDRIGQSHPIQIHIPYLEQSAQEIVFHWFDQGLDAFNTLCPAGPAVLNEVREELHQALREPGRSAEQLIAWTQKRCRDLNENLKRGRDRLLEYNSCRAEIALQLIREAEARDLDPELAQYMDSVFDCFGVDSEIQGPECLVLYPANHMSAPFPGLPDEGLTVTFDRKTALAREEIQYLSWDHPMVVRSMEQITNNELGNSAFTVFKDPQIASGSLLLESLYVLEAGISKGFSAARWLPPTAIRVVIDQNGRDYAELLSHDQIRKQQKAVNQDSAWKFIQAKQQSIRELLKQTQEKARIEVGAIISCAKLEASRTLDQEIDRLSALSRINPNIRAGEIEYLMQQRSNVLERIASASFRLDAIRVLFAL